MEKAVVSIWAGTTGELDEVPVEDIKRFETDFLDDLDRNHAAVLTTIRDTGELSDDTVTSLKSALTSFKAGFTTSDGRRLVHEAEVEALPEEDILKTHIKRPVRA